MTIIEMLDTVARDMNKVIRQLLLFSLEYLKVKILTNATAKAITDQGVLVERRGRQQLVEVDTIVLALGARSNRDLADQIKDLGIEIYIAGDCANVRKLPDAVEEGYEVALNV